MHYLSVCSGIEAATVAWHPLGWKPVGFAEIEPFPCALLAHHYPEIPNHGDITKYESWDRPAALDLLVGGTPCQAFSVAGLRKGLADPRGNLALTFLGAADRLDPEWLVWENVPGVLSQDGGRAFGSILGGMAELGYHGAYRVIDAQFCRVDGYERAVPQRRRRVFVVGNRRDWRRAAAVLFEPESLSGNPAPSRSARQSLAGCADVGAGNGSKGYDVAADRRGDARGDDGARAVDATVSHSVTSKWSKGTGGPSGDECQNLVAFSTSGNGYWRDGVGPLRARENDSHESLVAGQWAVRRLPPRECERLQGFPDDYTRVPFRHGKPAADGPRYKAIGNSMAVNVMRWLGRRIDIVAGAAAGDAA